MRYAQVKTDSGELIDSNIIGVVVANVKLITEANDVFLTDDRIYKG